ncbi:MAG: sigma-70 family RNA polymerase sigma factor [Lachnospiraceae bacterium]|nr:sigma-70 family RNA polymerase sigma factor [Lachnospiraceae bacterium]
MAIINLRKYYYPIYKKDTFVEVSDEVAEALLLLLREENNRERKLWYHKAFFSLDRDDGIENDAIGWEQPSPEEILIVAEEEAAHELLLRHLSEAFSILTPTQARRLHARYMLGMKIRAIAAAEGVNPSQVSDSVRSAIKKLQKHFKKQKWIKE